MSSPQRAPFVGDGLLVVDKPAGWTSHDVVARARRLCGTRKVGHAGTLDPMATGVLVLGVGRGTKLLTFLVGSDKAYTATVRLGQATLTDDAEGEVVSDADASGLSEEQIAAAVRDLTGDLEQVPSAVSAIKVRGERSYARVRSGQDVQLAARPVRVARFDVGQVRREGRTVDLDVEVEVSSGTYVRALARDLGSALGVGGHLIALRRTRVGGLRIEEASRLEELALDGAVARHLVPLADAARATLTARLLDDAEARELGHGRRIPSEQPGRTAPVAAFAPDGHLVAVLDESREQARAHVVLAPAGSG